MDKKLDAYCVIKICKYFKEYEHAFSKNFEDELAKKLLQAEEVIVKDLESQINWFREGGIIIEESENYILGRDYGKQRWLPCFGISTNIDGLINKLQSEVRKVGIVSKEVPSIFNPNKPWGDFQHAITKILSRYIKSLPHSLFNNDYEKLLEPLKFKIEELEKSERISFINRIENTLNQSNVYKDARKVNTLVRLATSLDSRLISHNLPKVDPVPDLFIKKNADDYSKDILSYDYIE